MRALAVVNIQLMRAPAALRCRSQAAHFADEALRIVNSFGQALAAQHADLDLDHVEPAGVLGGEVELQTAQDAPGFGGLKGLIEGTGRVGVQVILHNPDALERAGLIRRQPGVARSIELLVALEDLPILEWLKNQPVKTSVQKY